MGGALLATAAAARGQGDAAQKRYRQSESRASLATSCVMSPSLVAPAVDDGPTICPVGETTGGIDMPTLTQANVLGAPGGNLFLGVGHRRVGVIVAADHRYPIFAQRRGHRCKSNGYLWKRRPAGIRHGDQQGGKTGPIRQSAWPAIVIANGLGRNCRCLAQEARDAFEFSF